jgi:hypothetical protein
MFLANILVLSPPCGMETERVIIFIVGDSRSKPTVWDGDFLVYTLSFRSPQSSKPTVWDGDLPA